MAKTWVAVTVLVPVAILAAVWMWRAATFPPKAWKRQQLRHAAAGVALVVPGAIVLGAVDGTGSGVGALILWGVLGAVFFLATRLDVEEGGLDSDTRWLIDIALAAFLAVTVFFTVVGTGWVFLPSACLLLVAWRLARLRRRRAALRR